MEIENLDQELTEKFIELHKSQLQSAGVPEIYWQSLFNKLRNETFDAGNFFQICQRVDEDDEILGYKAICINNLPLDDPNGIFLIDHAWTYKVNDARQNLIVYDNLLERLCSLMNIQILENDEETADITTERKIEAVLEKMWKFNQTYKLITDKLDDEEREPIWYVMDEFGSSIRHNSVPSVEIKPFCYMPSKVMFSIMWPKVELKTGDELTRDYVYGLKDDFLRKFRSIPWNEEETNEELAGVVNGECTYHEEPPVAYFQSGRDDEKLPDLFDRNWIGVRDPTRVNVFTDLEAVTKHLTDPKYNLVDEITQADIIFISKHFKDYKSLYEDFPHCLVNQFPFENVVTVKDLLAICCRRTEGFEKWLPETYNLSYELPKFVAYFNNRQSADLDNYWILKPWNLARSIDMKITNNLDQIVRSIETGPKIACKYISNPVLFTREIGSVKFDIRYIVLLRSVQPLTLYVYKVFWLRFANKPYSLDSFDDYEKHFTVMNYKPAVNLKQINYDDFMPEFENQNPQYKWNDIQAKIFSMIRKVFEGASKEKPPKGISNNPQSRAMYAIDLMLDWHEDSNNNNSKTIEPMICEINFMPDCTRACKYHPNFFNDVFNTLFMDSLDHQNVIQI